MENIFVIEKNAIRNQFFVKPFPLCFYLSASEVTFIKSSNPTLCWQKNFCTAYRLHTNHALPAKFFWEEKLFLLKKKGFLEKNFFSEKLTFFWKKSFLKKFFFLETKTFLQKKIFFDKKIEARFGKSW